MPHRAQSSRRGAYTNQVGGVFPIGIPTSTLNIWAPPMPIFFIASRSAVIPALLMFPLIQCHQVCGLAEFGGFTKPLSNEDWAKRRGAKATMQRLATERQLTHIRHQRQVTYSKVDLLECPRQNLVVFLLTNSDSNKSIQGRQGWFPHKNTLLSKSHNRCFCPFFTSRISQNKICA